MRFLLDMGISPAVGEFLRTQGVDSLHLGERALARLSDLAILDLARQESRILVTHDLDFAELVAVAGTELPSVIIFRLRNMRPEHVTHYLTEVLTHYQAILEGGAIMTVTEGQIRVRSLPLRSTE